MTGKNNKRDIDVIAAGHLCLDLIPAFTLKEKADSITSVLIPGKMINMGNCVVVGGGPVTPGLAATNTNAPFLHCPIHGLAVFADGRRERERSSKHR